MDRLAMSQAHEWVGSNVKVECVRCGKSTKVGEWSIPRCVEHFVFADAGWSDEKQQSKD